jgi:hypothetical protein
LGFATNCRQDLSHQTVDKFLSVGNIRIHGGSTS